MSLQTATKTPSSTSGTPSGRRATRAPSEPPARFGARDVGNAMLTGTDAGAKQHGDCWWRPSWKQLRWGMIARLACSGVVLTMHGTPPPLDCAFPAGRAGSQRRRSARMAVSAAAGSTSTTRRTARPRRCTRSSAPSSSGATRWGSSRVSVAHVDNAALGGTPR